MNLLSFLCLVRSHANGVVSFRCRFRGNRRKIKDRQRVAAAESSPRVQEISRARWSRGKTPKLERGIRCQLGGGLKSFEPAFKALFLPGGYLLSDSRFADVMSVGSDLLRQRLLVRVPVGAINKYILYF